MGTADGLAATGTSVTSANATVRLENGITVANELLSSPSGINFNLASAGTGVTNVWTGNVTSGTYLFVRPSSGNTLRLDGAVSTSGSDLYPADNGKVAFHGSFSNVGRLYMGQGGSPTVEINANLSTTSPLFVNSGNTLAGTGALSWTSTSPAQINGTINPGTSAATAILNTDEVAFQSNGNLSVQLNGTTAGTQYDRLNVTGTVALAGTLNVTLGVGYTPAIGDAFTILTNDSTEAITGTFNGLGEGSLFAVGSDYFQISYAGGGVANGSNDVVLTKVLAGLWDGGGANSNWTTATNWAGDIAPVAGANLIFPTSAAQKTNVNDFAAGTNFGAILIQGSSYNLSGNQILLNGSVTSNGSGNTFGVGLKLAANGGFANTASSQFTVSGAIDTDGNVLNLNSASGTTVVSGQISGLGSVEQVTQRALSALL